MTELQIDVGMDHVDIEGQRIMRPTGIARSRWQDIWLQMNVLLGIGHPMRNEDLLQRLELADWDEYLKT
jgi:hypothetical protein